ncbi:hypothetical protein Taro_025713 [Colocasia esculenta]|uniref:Uncharacterized protein n=1 Tax=Colocasia esculenta TaxID=4460 RepID=A0A843VP47_COLES|nr:hypothetical protein [Colocasia esculenta]
MRLGVYGVSCPTEPVTCEAHPFFFQVKESRRIPVPLLVRDHTIVESGLHHQQSNVKESKRISVPLLVRDRTVVESGLHHQQSNVLLVEPWGFVPSCCTCFKTYIWN